MGLNISKEYIKLTCLTCKNEFDYELNGGRLQCVCNLLDTDEKRRNAKIRR